MLDPAIERAGARLIVESLPVVPGDRRELERLFTNLVGNALKHGHNPTGPSPSPSQR
jgi:signal transduction histidine kinase